MNIGRETGIPNSVNHAISGVYKAVQVPSASLIQRTVCSGRTMAENLLTVAAPSNRRAVELQAHGAADAQFQSREIS
jgi:hypothetical protein